VINELAAVLIPFAQNCRVRSIFSVTLRASSAMGSVARSGLELARRSGAMAEGYITGWKGWREFCWLFELEIEQNQLDCLAISSNDNSHAFVVIGFPELVNLRIQDDHVAVLAQQLLRQTRSILVQIPLVRLKFHDLNFVRFFPLEAFILQLLEDFDGGDRVVFDLVELLILVDQLVVVRHELLILGLKIFVVGFD
jgi:hypothetical protein